MRDTCGPASSDVLLAHTFHFPLPLIGTMEMNVLVMPATWIAIATAAFVTFLLYRRISVLGKLAELLWIGVAITMAWVIIAGFTHFSAARAFDFPAGRIHAVAGVLHRAWVRPC